MRYSIVELGSGSGYVITSVGLLLKQLGLHAHLLAIDHNAAAADATRQTLAAHQVRRQLHTGLSACVRQ